MSYNNHYFADKNMRSKMANIHTARMDKLYSNEIIECIRRSIVYGEGENLFCRKDIESIPKITTNIEVIDSGVVEALFRYKGESESMCVLNFASYTQPGGMYMEGSSAQEECLCSASFLYNVLSSNCMASFYNWNNKHKNNGLYLNRAIYTPGIKFFNYRDGSTVAEELQCSVITCASPNKRAAMKYGRITKEENLEAVSKRIEFILNIAANFYFNTLILGAFGCGVFGQDASDVATIFKNWLTGKYKNVFRHVVFAVPDSEHDINYLKFKNILSDCDE